MFFRRGIFMRTILLILLIGIFASVAGRRSYDTGWSDGYIAAQAMAQVEDGQTTVPSLPAPRGLHRGWGFSPLGWIGWFFAGLFKFFIFLLLIGLTLKLLVGGRWRRHHKHGHGHHPRWHGRHEEEAPREKSPEDVEPDIRSA